MNSSRIDRFIYVEPTHLAIIALLIIEVTALITGHNGQILRFVITTIAALAGYQAHKHKERLPLLNRLSN